MEQIIDEAHSSCGRVANLKGGLDILLSRAFPHVPQLIRSVGLRLRGGVAKALAPTRKSERRGPRTVLSQSVLQSAELINVSRAKQ